MCALSILVSLDEGSDNIESALGDSAIRANKKGRSRDDLMKGSGEMNNGME